MQGGAIYAQTNVQITIRDTKFESNTATNYVSAIFERCERKKPRDISSMCRGTNCNGFRAGLFGSIKAL